MQEILNQLGELVLGSIPTVCFFLLLLLAYSALVKRPLEKILSQRHARTGGAMDDANRAIAAAEEKSAAYEQRLREARAKISEARAARQKANAEARDHAIAAAREQAQRSIAAARDSVTAAGEQARQQIESGADALSEQIVAAILPHRSQQGYGVQA
jgi:F-type H+-transporting ATPase subunit b